SVLGNGGLLACVMLTDLSRSSYFFIHGESESAPMNSPEINTGARAVPAAKVKPLRDARGNVYEPAIGPRLKILLALIFTSVAILGATGAYLAAISFFNWLQAPQNYTNWFYMWMFLAHVAVGVVIAVPFLIFGFTHYFSARHRKNKVAV